MGEDVIRGLMDGTCPKCDARIGWAGSVADRPPCHRCGHQIAAELLEADDRALAEARERVLARVREREAREWAERTPEQEEAYRLGYASCRPGLSPLEWLNPYRAQVFTPGPMKDELERYRFWNWGWGDCEAGAPCRIEGVSPGPSPMVMRPVVLDPGPDRAVLTGSQVYGQPTEESDVDLVVLVEQDDFDKLLEHFPPTGDPDAYKGCPAQAVRCGKLNLIMVTSVDHLECWRGGTRMLKERAEREGPLPRSEAVALFRHLRGLPPEEGVSDASA